MRKDYKEIEKIKSDLNIDKLWSWSRMNSFNTSKFEYYLKYIKKEKELNPNGVYLTMGNITHELLEDFYNGKIVHEQMGEIFQNMWTMSIDVLDLRFDRNDRAKNDLIKNKYYQNLKLFFENHERIDKKVVLEHFVLTKITDDIYFQGYVDCVYKDDNECFNVIDFKTSTIYQGDKKDNECGQLVLYALHLIQQGIPIEKIKIAWLFIKYVNVAVSMKNGTTKVRKIERNKLGESLISNCSMWLKAEGYKEEEIDKYIAEIVSKNSIDSLPDKIKSLYKVEDCYIYVDLTEELVSEWKNKIIETTSSITELEDKFKETFDESIFWDEDESLKKQLYYYSNLSGYTIQQNNCLKSYLDRIEKEKEGDLLYTATDDSLDWLKNV